MQSVIVIIVILLLCSLFFLRSELEKRSLSVEHYHITTDKDIRLGEAGTDAAKTGAEGPEAAATDAGNRGTTENDSAHRGTAKSGTGRGFFRLVFLTDLHDASFGEHNSRLLDKIDELAPDAVIIGGDMLNCSKKGEDAPDTEVPLELIRALAAKYRLFIGEGNHETRMEYRFPAEYKDYRKSLEEAGAVYLKNASACLKEGICVSAVSLDAEYIKHLKPGIDRRIPMPPEYLKNKLACPDADAFSILMLHSPLYLKNAEAWGADLVLSGHFHGGTIRLPIIGGLMTPQYQFFVKECAGFFTYGKCSMAVSRGLGTHTINIRFNNRPEITVADIMSSKSTKV